MSKYDGYIPISRKLFEHPFWTQKRVFSYAEAWIDLISMARYEETATKMIIRNQTIEINRGEVPVSLRYLAERWSWSKNKVVLFLEKLTNELMIKMGTLKGTTQTILTICNYDTYNSLSEKEGQQKGQEKDSKGTVKGQLRDKTNKDNKDNKEINNTSSLPKQAKEVTLVTKCRNVFEGYFLEHYSDSYYWEAKDAANMKQIINKLKNRKKEKGLSVDDESITNALNLFLESIQDDWLLKNFSVPNINSKFNEIISSAKNGNRKNASIAKPGDINSGKDPGSQSNADTAGLKELINSVRIG